MNPMNPLSATNQMNAAPEHRHQIFGLNLALPYASHLLPPAPPALPPDARVALGRVPAALPGLLAGLDVPEFNARVEVGPAGEVLWLRPSSRFLISGGDSITVEPLRGQPPAALHSFIEHYCLPALLIQRGLVALHANALAGPRGALVLLGASGAGKSTLHAALMKRGLPMLSDDVAALRLAPDGQVWVLPGARRYRLCADALQQVAPVAEHLRPLAGDPRRKVLARAPLSAFQSQPAPLAAIYLLDPHDGAELSVTPVLGVEKFRLLANGSYPPLSLTFQPAHLAAIQRLLPLVSIIRLRRPRRRWTVEELADAILA